MSVRAAQSSMGKTTVTSLVVLSSHLVQSNPSWGCKGTFSNQILPVLFVWVLGFFSGFVFQWGNQRIVVKTQFPIYLCT